MALDNFEQELFDDLAGYQSDQDLNLDQEWSDLETKLPKKKDKRRFFFWWWGSSLAAIALLVGLLLNKNDFKSTINEQQVYQTSPEIDNSNILNSINTTEIVSSSESIQVQKNTTTNEIEKDQPQLKNSATSFLTNANIETVEIKNPRTVSAPIIPSDFRVNSQFSKTSKTTVNIFTTNDQKNKNKFIGENSPIISIEKEGVIEDAVLLSNILEDNSTIDTQKEIAINNENVNAIDTLDEKEKIVIEKAEEALEGKLISLAITNNWSLTASGIYGLNKINRTTSLDNQSAVDFISNYEEPTDFAAFDLKLMRTLNKHISIFSGVRWSQHTSLFNLNDVFDVERIDENVLTEEIYYLAGNVEYNYGPAQYNVTVRSKLWQKYQSISIPIGVSVHTSLLKKWSVQNDFAIYISPFQNNVGRKVIKTETDYFVFDNQNYTTKLFFGLGNQLAVNFKLSPKFLLQFNFDTGIDLSSRLNTEQHYQLRFSHIGAGLGGKYVF